GRDRVAAAGGRQVELTRYRLSGLIWGREWVWFDDGGDLVAAVTEDAEFDHFEAVRDGFEPGLRTFVARAAEDGMAQLFDFGRRLSPPQKGPIAIRGALLIDGTGRPPTPDATVVLDGDRIVAVGPRRAVAIPRDANIIEAHGAAVLPGLWDMHAHF